MKLFSILSLAGALGFGLPAFAQTQETLYVDAGSHGHDINPDMYGIFFEEINHSGDGGLYAELIQNRGFEEQTIPGGFSVSGTNRISTPSFKSYTDLSTRQLNWDWDFDRKKMTGWRVECTDCQVQYDVVTPQNPLHEATPNAMFISTGSAGENPSARLINSGYWGIAVEKGEKYKLRFYVSSSEGMRSCEAYLVDPDGNKVGSTGPIVLNGNGEWQECNVVITADASVNDAEFVLQFNGNGVLYVDYVSLFPEKTFKNRENGLRADLAELLTAMRPRFMRWPGGCIVEGIVLENRVKWKETLGDPMTRPGQYDLWGYRSTWGLGYHEILQFCEDAGMDCMFVGNAGLSCIGWGGEFVSPGSDLDPYYIDIRDAIEYAIGDPASNEWAAKRAAAGHPAPFPLKYVEIGNENFGARYDANYKYIYERLKTEYPQLTFLNTMGLEHAVEFDIHTDMIDPHWYVAPDFFYNNRTMFDRVPRGNYKIYVGEYATNVGVGQGNMDAALSEAVFMMDMERNSDIVRMASYAPLIENSNARNWTCNLIWQRSGESFGRASYHVQKMFSENIADYNLPSSLQTIRAKVPYNGRIGLGTWNTSATYRNLKVSTPEGETLYTSDFSGRRDDWSDMQGNWTVDADGNLKQTATSVTNCISLMNTLSFRDCVIEVEGMKNSGSEGFLVVFGGDDTDWTHFYQLNIGGWSNTKTGLQEVNNGTGTLISEQKAQKIDTGKWYKIRLVCAKGKVDAYIDGEYVCGCDFGSGVTIGRLSAHAGYDSKNGEVVVKVVNAEDTPLPLTLKLNAGSIESTANVETLSAPTLWDENSFSAPDNITPVKSVVNGFGGETMMTFEPRSLTVVRVKASPAVAPMDIPPYAYSSEPKVLDKTAGNNWHTWLKETLKEAEGVLFFDLEGYDALKQAYETSKGAIYSPDEADCRAATETLRSALASFYRLRMVEANEVEGKIVNGDFPRDGDNTGWTGNPVVRSHVAEIFNANFNVSQTVTGLEDGWYMVYAQGFYRYGGQKEANKAYAAGTALPNARMVVGDREKPVVSSMSETHNGYWWGAPNSMEEAWTVFSENPGNYANCEIARVTDGTLEISFKKSQLKDSDWFIFGNVRLYRVPTNGAGVEEIEAGHAEGFSPEAKVYDLQGRFMGPYAGWRRLLPGVYMLREGDRSAKIRIK